MNAIPPLPPGGLDRVALPLCASLALLGSGIAATMPSHRVEALGFMISATVLSFVVLRFSSARLAVTLSTAAATLVSGFDLWLREAASPGATLTLGLCIVVAAFYWARWAPWAFGLIAALVMVAHRMGLFFGGFSNLGDASRWSTYRESGELLAPAALVVAGVAARFLPPRFPLRATPPTASPPTPAMPTTQLLEGLPHAVAVYDREARVIATNNVWRRLHSATADDPSGEHSGALELHDRGSDTFRRCLSGEDIRDERNLLLHPDGGRDWISTSMSPWYEDGDTVWIGGVVVTQTVVTELVELEGGASKDLASEYLETGDLETEDESSAAADGGDSSEPDLVALEAHAGHSSSRDVYLAHHLLEQYLQVFPDVFIVLTPGGTVASLHSAPGVQGGLATMDLVGTDLGAIFPALYDVTRPGELERIRREGKLVCQEFELPGTSASRPMLYQARIAPLEDGGFVVLNRDLTEEHGDRGNSSRSEASPARDESEAEPRGDASAPVKEPVHLQRALDRALASLASDIEKAGAHVFVGQMPEAQAELGDVALVFENLLSNALEHRSPSSVDLEIEIEATSTDGLVQVDIVDNGRGIGTAEAQGVADTLGRPSPPSPDAGTAVQGGDEVEQQGRDLTLCKRLVERHGGSMWIDTEVASGARVTFTLPSG